MLTSERDNAPRVWYPRGDSAGHLRRLALWLAPLSWLYGAGVACWRLYREGEDGMVAVSADKDGAPPLTVRLIRRDRSPVLCPEGPGV